MAHENYSLNNPTTLSDERARDELEIIISLLLLLILLFFSYTEIFLKPNMGFSINLNNGVINGIDPPAEGYLQAGDKILRVNDLPIEKVNDSIWLNPFIRSKAGEVLTFDLIRQGELLTVEYPKPSQEMDNLLQVLSSDWILPYPFFAAGLITVLFLRPRTRTRNLLVAFFYIYAIWISAGLISSTGYWYSPAIMRAAIWVSVPLSFHLHWLFPKPFKPLKSWLIWGLYSIFILLAVMDFTIGLPANLYLLGFVISMLTALVILVIKLIHFKEARRILRTLIYAYILAVLPLILMTLLMFLKLTLPMANIALLGLTAIPGFYFFSAYRAHLNREIPRVNRAMRLYYGAIGLEFLISFIFIIFPKLPIYAAAINFLSFLLIVMITMTGFGILLVMPALANDQINLFKNEPYALRFSANRAAAFVIFILVLAPTNLLVLLLIHRDPAMSFANIFISTLATLFIVGVSVLIYRSYQRFFDRVILGIRYTPEALIRSYAQRISTSLEKHSLADLIKNEILPSLMIRQSALLTFSEQDDADLLVATGVDPEMILPEPLKIWTHAAQRPWHTDAIKNSMPWINLAIPLQIGSETVGVWCFGHKDPNDIYSPDFINDLSSLAHQTTLALLNIQQAGLLQKLYSSNIERQEAEKSAIARDLHDVILPSIGYLVELYLNEPSHEAFEAATQRINNMIRNIMSGLRPATLDLGLPVALEELADEPVSQIGGKIDIKVDLFIPEPVTYERKAELHLYRIIQQTCRNALLHGNAQTIMIRGSLHQEELDLYIEDDGLGFPVEEILDFETLIANQHFGLANMYERAKLIDGTIKIDSAPGKGTRVHLYWKPKNHH
jgi:signal transduction histidine kinase